jgi:hypothetical protein
VKIGPKGRDQVCTVPYSTEGHGLLNQHTIGENKIIKGFRTKPRCEFLRFWCSLQEYRTTKSKNEVRKEV